MITEINLRTKFKIKFGLKLNVMKLHTTRSEVLLENYIKTQIKNLIMEVYETSAFGLNKGKI
jgi:hypothetical protein